MKQISKEPLRIPVTVKVWQDYNALDRYAAKLGYSIPEDCPTSRTGWIPTMGDEYHNPQTAINDANEKLQTAQHLHKDAVIGLCQTGNFSVGYSIYVRD